MAYYATPFDYSKEYSRIGALANNAITAPVTAYAQGEQMAAQEKRAQAADKRAENADVRAQNADIRAQAQEDRDKQLFNPRLKLANSNAEKAEMEVDEFKRIMEKKATSRKEFEAKKIAVIDQMFKNDIKFSEDDKKKWLDYFNTLDYADPKDQEKFKNSVNNFWRTTQQYADVAVGTGPKYFDQVYMNYPKYGPEAMSDPKFVEQNITPNINSLKDKLAKDLFLPQVKKLIESNPGIDVTDKKAKQELLVKAEIPENSYLAEWFMKASPDLLMTEREKAAHEAAKQRNVNTGADEKNKGISFLSNMEKTSFDDIKPANSKDRNIEAMANLISSKKVSGEDNFGSLSGANTQFNNVRNNVTTVQDAVVAIATSQLGRNYANKEMLENWIKGSKYAQQYLPDAKSFYTVWPPQEEQQEKKKASAIGQFISSLAGKLLPDQTSPIGRSPGGSPAPSPVPSPAPSNGNKDIRRFIGAGGK